MYQGKVCLLCVLVFSLVMMANAECIDEGQHYVVLRLWDTYCDRISYFTQEIMFCEIIRCVTIGVGTCWKQGGHRK